MRIAVKLFAIIRERAGATEALLELKSEATVADAVTALSKRFPAITDLLPRAAFAINQSYVARETVLHDGDELAVIPPVSGG